jgi:hypothetical protein
VPWHVLPRKAADVSAEVAQRGNGPVVKLRNRGLADSEYDVFALTGVSRRVPRTDLPQPGDNFAVVDMRAVGVRYLAGPLIGAPFDILEFAINTNGRRAHPNYPAEFDVEIDIDGDGTPDYLVFNAENGAFASTGQNVVFLADLKAGGPASGQFFTDADLNSGNVIFSVVVNAGPGTMTVPAGATLGFTVRAFDNYFTGNETDAIEGMRFTPSLQRYVTVGGPFGSLAARSSDTLSVVETTVPAAQSTESGLLMMYRRNADKEASALRIR